jgi:transposase
VVSGNSADDGLYIPAIDQARSVVGQTGLLYIGDRKMEALSTRAHLVAGGDYYLTPLSLKGAQADLLDRLVQPVLDEEQDVLAVYREPVADQDPKLLFSGYESSQHQEMQVGEELVQWTERILVVHSPGWAKRSKRGLQGRLQRAAEKLLALTPEPGRGKRQYDQLAALQAAAEAILQHHRVTGLLLPTYERQASQRQVRKYKDRPARIEENVRYQIHVSRNETAIQAQYRTMGWRLYALNVSVEQLSFSQAVLAYRGAPNIERDFSRLKGRPLGLRPVYVQREDHLKGLVRLLSLGLSILTLTEFVARRALATADDELAGLYPGNPKQTTNRPTTERLLAAFKEINLSVVCLPDQTIVHITPLSSRQNRILELLDLPSSIYTNLAVDIRPNPP